MLDPAGIFFRSLTIHAADQLDKLCQILMTAQALSPLRFPEFRQPKQFPGIFRFIPFARSPSSRFDSFASRQTASLFKG